MNFKQLLNSFQYAWSGLKHAYSREQNFRIQLLAAAMVLLLAIFLRVDLLRAGILVLVIVNVLILELLNTLTERMVDILEPRLHHYVQVIKDIMASAVFLASLGALVVGLLVLWPYLSNFVSAYIRP